MNILKNIKLYILIIVIVLADQLLKFIVVSRLYLHEQVTVIDGFFYITYVKNTGGAFSLLSQRSWGIYILSVLSLMIVVVLIYLMNRFNQDIYKWVRLLIAVLIGGAFGNLIDRVFQGAVVDFLMFVFGSYTFPIFNLADICIVVSSLLLAAFLIFDKRLLNQDSKSKDNVSEQEDISIEDQTQDFSYDEENVESINESLFSEERIDHHE